MKRAFILFLLLLLFALIYGEQRVVEPLQPTLFATQLGDDCALQIRGALLRAQHSIFLVIFSLKDEMILKTLEERADAGVSISVIYDIKQGLKRSLGKKIKAEPRNLHGYHMHRKILVIDEEEIWIGSANFTTSSLKLHDNLILAFKSPEMAKALTRGPPLKNHLFNVCGQSFELWLTPEDEKAEKRLIELLGSAQKTIKIALFAWTNPRLVKAAINAKKRGVEVDVVIEKSSSLVNETLKKLTSCHIHATKSKKNVLFHHKFAYIDGKKLVLGSANWSKSAFGKNQDCYLIVHDLTQTQRAFMDELWCKIEAECF